MTRFQMLLKEETGAGFLARMAVMLPVFLIVYHLSAGPVRGRYTLPATTPEQLVSEESRAGINAGWETEPCWSDSAFTGATRMR